MKWIFDFNEERCMACGACAVACMDQNDTDLASGETPFRKTFSVERGMDFKYISVACMHCEDAPCVSACPSGCISVSESGLVTADPTNCIGCHSCSNACPFGAPRFGPDGKMKKCDGCRGRLENGLLPACVRICPFDAIKVYSDEEYAALEKEKALRILQR